MIERPVRDLHSEKRIPPLFCKVIARGERCVNVQGGLGGYIAALVRQGGSGAIVKRFTVPLFQVAYRLFESDFAVSGSISTP
ncbi:hypothetical protein CAL30_01520 [Megasphaera hutchinsoni]|jgi:hypothetical protein|uniref:Uncharacterized protein n=1 Tax=Megasphaera hutchinsoni TaxID=1588748 RepID=A0A2J8BC17_9FIRM|nr:hypothetical protein CAL30_01520 [Megasphaera genomosp. type_2]